MLKYGILSEIDYTAGRARVFIDEDDIVTDWLTLPKNINENRYFALKQQVAVLFHKNGEDGEILHEVPTDETLPPSWANDHTEGVQFKDGTTVTYDSTSKKLKIDAGTGELEFVCSKLKISGNIECTKLTASSDVVAGVTNISLTGHTHTTPSGPSGPPIAT